MTPDTVHLLARIIRNERDMLTALEQWLVVQVAQDPSMEKLLHVSRQARRTITMFEGWLSEQPTETTTIR